jgi:copper oxidase (laccase) domain-containing protein
MRDEIKIYTFEPGAELPAKVITPQQRHSAHIVKIETGLENLNDCDGLWTKKSKLLLGVKTADCAPICIWNDTQFGIVHAGWRGTVNGAIENLRLNFETGLEFGDRSPNFKIWVGPILPRFEIQKDNCYDQLKTKFGSQFFTKTEDKIYFEFKKCLQFLLPTALFDSRSTFDDLSLASWRRDKAFPKGQNTTVIGFSKQFKL